MEPHDTNPYESPANVEPNRRAHRGFSTSPVLIAATVLMIFALALSNVTVASGRYGGVLLAAAACAFLSLFCLTGPLVRGPWQLRMWALVVMPTVVIVIIECLRRAPYVFGGG